MPASAESLPVALPPNPNTHPPGWALTAGACDSHFHVFGPPDRFPYAATRRYERPAAPIEDYWNVHIITGLARAVVVQPTAHGNTFTPGRTPNEGDLLDFLGVIAPDEQTRRRILVDNPARLYGFEGGRP